MLIQKKNLGSIVSKLFYFSLIAFFTIIEITHVLNVAADISPSRVTGIVSKHISMWDEIQEDLDMYLYLLLVYYNDNNFIIAFLTIWYSPATSSGVYSKSEDRRKRKSISALCSGKKQKCSSGYCLHDGPLQYVSLRCLYSS